MASCRVIARERGGRRAAQVTLYAPDGRKRWQMQAHATWQRGGYDGNQDVSPTLQVFAPRVGGQSQAILAAGATSAQIITPSGRKMQKLDLPDVPTLPLTIVDLNGVRSVQPQSQ